MRRRAYGRSVVTNGSRLLRKDRTIDGRSYAARRYRDLVQDFSANIGGFENLTEADRALVKQAAGLIVEAEKLQADIIRGTASDDRDYIIRLNSEARRALSLLRRSDQPPARPATSLSDYIAGRVP